MKAVVIALLLAFLAAFAYAQKPQSQQPNEIAHGSEKVGAEAAHPGENEGGPHEGPKFLGIPAWIWKFVNMVAFLLFLGWLLRGPVKGALVARHEKIQREAEEAKQRRAKADQLAADIQARLASIEGELQAIRERAQVEGERQKREMIAAAEAEAQKILQGARNEVDNRLKYARQELTEYAGQLASERAEQLLRDKITDTDREKLFRDSLNQVEGAHS